MLPAPVIATACPPACGRGVSRDTRPGKPTPVGAPGGATRTAASPSCGSAGFQQPKAGQVATTESADLPVTRTGSMLHRHPRASEDPSFRTSQAWVLACARMTAFCPPSPPPRQPHPHPLKRREQSNAALSVGAASAATPAAARTSIRIAGRMPRHHSMVAVPLTPTIPDRLPARSAAGAALRPAATATRCDGRDTAAGHRPRRGCAGSAAGCRRSRWPSSWRRRAP